MRPKTLIKELLGEMPFSVEAYWLLRHRDHKIASRFNLEALAAATARNGFTGDTVCPLCTGRQKNIHFWLHAFLDKPYYCDRADPPRPGP